MVVDSLFDGTDDEVGRRAVACWVVGNRRSPGRWDWRFAVIDGAPECHDWCRHQRSVPQIGSERQSGVAKPKRDNYIEIAVHPRYKTQHCPLHPRDSQHRDAGNGR